MTAGAARMPFLGGQRVQSTTEKKLPLAGQLVPALLAMGVGIAIEGCFVTQIGQAAVQWNDDGRS